MIRKSGERIALNTPIQGTAADIMKMAMIHVYRRLQKESFRSHLILQIHDELIIDAPKDEADDVLALLIEEMENTVQLAVPLVVDAHQGDSWYAIK
jgi:DNA polymerase-1